MNGSLYLASRSPRRRELLGQLGLTPEAAPTDVDETPRAGEAPAEYVVRLALAKARAGLARCAPGSLVLGADTALAADGRILGKPADREGFRHLLRRLSGREHKALTGVALVGEGLEETRLSVSHVFFRAVREAEIDAYWATGEPADKAGGYAIQGLGAVFVERLEGSYSGVMGLPLFETAELLHAAGFSILRGGDA